MNASCQPVPRVLKGDEHGGGPPRPPARRASDEPVSKHVALGAPERLVSETRVVFRQAALAYVDESARDDRPCVDIDLGGTIEIDASGLGILVLIERRARAHGLRTRLLGTQEPVRRLLALTKLDELFDLVG